MGRRKRGRRKRERERERSEGEGVRQRKGHIMLCGEREREIEGER